MVIVSVKSWQWPGREWMAHEVKIKPTGLLLDVETSFVSNFMDFGSVSIDNTYAPIRFHSYILSWNCRGLGNPIPVDAPRHFCEIHKQDILILNEIRLERGRALATARRLSFDSSLTTRTIGRKRDILLLWNSQVAQASLVAMTEQEIHVMIQAKNSNFLWLLSAIYASPRVSGKSYCG